MDGMNLKATVNTVVNLDRHQEQSHRVPMEHQVRNAEAEAMNARQRLMRPVEPDQVKGKVIDPQDKRKEQERKKQKKKGSAFGSPTTNRPGPSGHFVDLDA